jgi:hypothetical protein
MIALSEAFKQVISYPPQPIKRGNVEDKPSNGTGLPPEKWSSLMYGI